MFLSLRSRSNPLLFKFVRRRGASVIMAEAEVLISFVKAGRRGGVDEAVAKQAWWLRRGRI